MVKKFILIFMLILNIFSINAITDTNLIFYAGGDTMTTNPSTIYGGVTDNLGILGRSNTFQFGSSKYIRTGITNSQLTPSFSFSVWVKPTSLDIQNYILSSDICSNVSCPATNTRGVALYLSNQNGGRVQFIINGATTQELEVSSTSSIIPGNWYHIVSEWEDSTKSSKIYINGVLDTSTTVLNGNPTINNIANEFYIGREINKVNGMRGDIDEIVMYNKLLTQQEITNLYQAGNPTQNANSVVTGELYYNDFEFLKDETGLTNGMSGFNGLGIGNLGKLSTGFNFDGINDYGKINNFPILSNTFSYSFWLNLNSVTAGLKYILDSHSGTTLNRYILAVDGTTGTYKIFNGANSWIDTGINYNVGVNTYLSLIFNNNNVEFFVNGVSSFTSTITPITPTPNLVLGSAWSGGGSYLNGNLDELGIWDRVLSPTEITQLYNGGVGLTYNQIKNPIQMSVITPQDLTNYTFDVINVPVTVNTAIATNCSLTNDFDNSTILFTNTGNLAHSTNLNLPVAINQSQTFNVDFTCNNGVYTQSTILTLFKQRIPLSLDIIVPKANQIFNVDTGQIEFFLETNYQTDCSYQRDTEFVRTPFTFTGGAFHKTNFTTDLNVSTYNMNFLCVGNIINENASKNITFFLDELTKFSLTKTTTQLPQVGKDVGGFLSNLAPSVAEFMLNFVIITLVVSMVVVPVMFIRKFNK